MSRSQKRDPKKPDPNRGPGSKRAQNLAIQIVNGDHSIIEVGAGIYNVPSQSSGSYYIVNLLRDTCSCPSWRKRKEPCKHIYAARMYRAKIYVQPNDTPTPNRYKNPPYYDRVRRVQRECIRAVLRCVGRHLSNAA